MAPTTAQLSSQLRQVIYYHLDNNNLHDALFFAGRLHALDPRGPDSVHLLSLSHLRLCQYKAAYDYSRLLGLRGVHLGCSYVLAQACLALERHTDGVTALERSRALWEKKNHLNKHSETSRRHVPDAATVYCLLGKLLQANYDVKRAVDCYAEALKLNPFMWDAFERLCNTGTNIRVSSIFKASPQLLAVLSASMSNLGPLAEEPHDFVASTNMPPPNSFHKMETPHADPFHPTRSTDDPGLSLGGKKLFSKLNVGLPEIDLPNGTSSVFTMETPPSSNANDVAIPSREESIALLHAAVEPPNAPLRMSRTIQGVANERVQEAPKFRSLTTRSQSKSVSEDMDAVDPPRPTSGQMMHHKRTVSGNVSGPTLASGSDMADGPPTRRSVRLFSRPALPKNQGPMTAAPTREIPEPRKARATGTRGRSAASSTVGRVVSGNRKPLDAWENAAKDVRPQTGLTEPQSAAPRSRPPDAKQDQESIQWLLDLMGKFGQGYFALSRFQCQNALQIFSSLPAQHRESPWVLAQIGKAHYEQANYKEAEKCFARIRKMVPSRVRDMEIYSTVLWHLKNDTELAFLAHELIDADRLSPQAWCTIGNSFSLQRDHDQALKCFKRTTQLNPNFAYGYTLQGHEHVANEEYEKALWAYRKAISADHRHYNGWYGLGKVYEKLGKYDMAEKHYRSASIINPTNAILYCCIGMVLERLKKPQAALDQYNRACDLAPSSAISRFKKARVLLHLQRPRDALEEFKVLKDMVPDESNVHFMLGRVYKMLHEKPLAIRHFTTALNLDPKAAPYIKEAMEALDDDNDVEDEDDQMT